MSHGLVVLGWHNVEPSHCFPSPGERGRTGLIRQLRLLKRLATIVPLEQALDSLRSGRALPRRAVAITFDDGYRDNVTVAGPLLRELQVPATCFVVPGILSRTVAPWWEKLAWAFAHARNDHVEWGNRVLRLGDAAARHVAGAEVAEALKRQDHATRHAAVDELAELLDPPGHYPVDEQFLDWDGARRLREFMDVQSHSSSHAILAEESGDDQCRDLAQARQRIQDRLDVDAGLLAYPNGGPADYDTRTVQAARAAGYSHAITTQGGLNSSSTPPYEIRRTVMNPERGAVELLKVVRDAFGPPRHRADATGERRIETGGRGRG